MTQHQSAPDATPIRSGMLDVGDGQAIYYEVSGNPDGIAAVGLHGGPGSGLSQRMRSFFDPQRYRVVLFDQRGAGQSRPSAADPDTDLSVNTTSHLIADMEKLRAHLGVDRWLVLGHSWGSTLALAYAEAHPASTAAMVLVGVTMTRQREIDWLYADLAPLFPAEWLEFRAGVPAERRDGDLVAAYADLLKDPDPAVRDKAARDFHAWDSVSVSGTSDPAPASEAEVRRRYGRARIVTHYFRHAAWLAPDQLLRGVDRLAGIPAILVQGRLDLQAPLETAWTLSRVWLGAELVIVGDAGHSTSNLALADAIRSATDRLAVRLSAA